MYHSSSSLPLLLLLLSLEVSELPLELLDAYAQGLGSLRLLDGELLHDLDEAPEPQHDDERRDLRRDAVLQQVYREADQDHERVELVEPTGEEPAGKGLINGLD
ncbi:hypothetical protein O1611_g10381 [Lasiodiplodia mahajangana]|uniref:Uncharacterized protein n=1 Tax=Lasiodiplodia mahajangana TaxID=1108764 RepID=A0ACC2IYS4_9PEZI|nr:hypothetical protein O1611_g10381 [Lasiodiplodia mahajangana]